MSTKHPQKMLATAVVPLTEENKIFLYKLGFRHEFPENAKYIAFLEDGDACYLEEELQFETGNFRALLGTMHMLRYHEGIEIEFPED